MDVNREIASRMPALQRAAGRIAARFGLPNEADELLSRGLLEIARRLHCYQQDALPFYRGGMPFDAWLFFVAKRHMRHQASRMRGKTTPITSDMEFATSGGRSPESLAAEHEDRRRVGVALQRIGDDQRQVIRNIYMEGMTTRQAYRLSGVAWATFRARHDAGLTRLREAFQGAK